MRQDNFFKQSIMAQLGAETVMRHVCQRLHELGVSFTVIQDSIHIDRVPDGVILNVEQLTNEAFLLCGELRSPLAREQKDVRTPSGDDKGGTGG